MPHIHEKIDYVSDVFIVEGDAVLLRMHDKYEIWLPPGGHVELDEDPVQAALREVKEEVGIPISLYGLPAPSKDFHRHDLLMPQFMNRHRVTDTHEHISFIYFARAETREICPQEGEKTDGFKWFTAKELDDESFGILEGVRMHAHAALRALYNPL